jgi:hypothetical protein
MITIKRVGTKVQIILEGGPLEASYPFTHECGNEHYAELLAGHFINSLYKRVESIRLKEYESGYNDHKKKKPKRDWSYSTLKNEVPNP